jgi:flagellar motor switch protein FliG
LLDAFLKNAFIFRLYYEKLDTITRSELCAALNGPAFNTLMDSLKLKLEETEGIAPPSEDQVQFYLKNFSEFHEAMRWQDEQFFGFLPHLTQEQLLALVQSQSPVVSALILKFSKPDVAASVLEGLTEKFRISVIDQFERTREMSPDELKSIEKMVRSSVKTLPNFILGTARLEQEYWNHLLSATTDPAKLLTSLEEARPDLYEKLAKFRFQLQDLPSLPQPLVRKVLDDIENDEIARAFSGLHSDLIAYALNELPEARRRLLEGQILSYQNVESFEVRKSVDTLTKKFREVLT